MLSESSSWAAYLYCLTQPFSTGAIVTVDGGTVLA
jgi:hypothetical protein